MLHNAKKLIGYKIAAIDGEIGKVSDFYFDDHLWIIRYLIADTGGWLTGKKVLIAPHSLNKPDWNKEIFPVDLTKEQIEKSPEINSDEPVSKQHETELTGYYGWPDYWTGMGGPVIGGFSTAPVYTHTKSQQEIMEMQKEEKKGDPNLRSIKEVTGYNIHATDDNIGHVEDFIIDDAGFQIRYMIVDTKNLLPGKKVIVALPWIKKITWTESAVYVDLPVEKIKSSPEYDYERPIDRDYEIKLYEYYEKEKYWK